MCLLWIDALQPFLSLQRSRLFFFFFLSEELSYVSGERKKNLPQEAQPWWSCRTLSFSTGHVVRVSEITATVRRSSSMSWSVTEYFPSQNGKCRKWAADKILPPSCICSGPIWGAVLLHRCKQCALYFLTKQVLLSISQRSLVCNQTMVCWSWSSSRASMTVCMWHPVNSWGAACFCSLRISSVKQFWQIPPLPCCFHVVVGELGP